MKNPLGPPRRIRGQFGSKLQVYQPVQLVTSTRARELGIITDKPAFISRKSFNRVQTTVYQVGSEVEAPEVPEEEGKLIVYPDLKTALDDELPFIGFIAVGEVSGNYNSKSFGREFQGRYLLVDKVHILGIKAFIKRIEVKMGYVNESFPGWSNRDSSLRIVTPESNIVRGSDRFAFRITQTGEVLFRKVER